MFKTIILSLKKEGNISNLANYIQLFTSNGIVFIFFLFNETLFAIHTSKQAAGLLVCLHACELFYYYYFDGNNLKLFFALSCILY